MTHQEHLRGEYVHLRPLTADDAELTLGWRLSNRARFLNEGAQTVEQQKDWIESRPHSEFNFIIELMNETPVGMLSLVDVSRSQRRGETARFLIGNEEAVQGIPAAVEAMKLLYDFAFDELGLHRLYGTISEKNKLMVKWQKYLGMQEEGRLRDHYFIDNQFQDAVYMGLLLSDYKTKGLPRMRTLIAAGSRRTKDSSG